MHRSTLTLGAAILLASAPTLGAEIEEIVVTGDLREAELLRTPASVTVVDAEAIARAARPTSKTC